MGYLDYAGLQYLWGKLKEKFAPKSHSHDDRYYTESEMDGKLNSKVDNNEAGANGLLSKLSVWTATPTDDTYFMRQDTGGGNSFGRVKFSTLWNYIKGKADGVYQPKGSYAASGHTHDDRYYTESEMNTKLAGKSDTNHGHPTSKIVLDNSTNYAGYAGPIEAAHIDVLRANRLAFLPASGIKIEYSIDGGATWIDYGATDDQKASLFAMRMGSAIPFYTGKHTKADECTTKDQLRITITPVDRYASVNMLYLWVSVAGTTATVDIARSTIGAKETFTDVRTDVPINGWSGPNEVRFSQGTFGGGSTQNYNAYSYRFTFKNKADGKGSVSVMDIRMYGPSAWGTANSMMEKDHIYSWDTNQNVSFPAQVTATKFNGSATGVRDYNNDNGIIKIGFSGAGLTKDNLTHIAGYTDNGNKIKDVSRGVLQSWLNLNEMINTQLTTGSSTPSDNDFYISQYAGGGSTTTTYHRRPVSALWTYIKGKADAIYAAKSHTHTKAQITDFPASLKNPTALTIQTNGTTAATYDGSAAKTVNVTKGNIGLGNVDNTADANKSVKYATSAGSASTATKANVADSANALSGLSSSSSQGWGVQTGTFVHGEGDSTGGDFAFRRNCPNAGQLSMVLDGRFYQNEGQYRVLDTSDEPNLNVNSANFAKETYINQYKIINLTDLDQNTWYPVTGTSLPYNGLRHFKCSVHLNSGSKPSWSTHSGGFTAVVDILEEAFGWGTTGMLGEVLINDQRFIADESKPPVGYQQMGYGSIPVWWLRGGGSYRLAADYDVTWTIQKSKYENSGQSVSPTTTYPGVSVQRSTIMANLNGNASTATKATSADYLNFTSGNEINFTGKPDNSTVYFGYHNTLINEYKFNNGNGSGGLASITAAAFNGKATSAGTADSADSATTSNGVKDYNNANGTIKIGFAGAGLTTENLGYVAGYAENGTKIKDVSKDVLKSWIGLGNYLPLVGGTMSGQITKSTGGTWIGDRDRAAVKSSYAGDSSYGAVAAMATKNGYWTMGNLGGDESLIFNYSTDANYNVGKNETSQVYLPAQAGTIITSATIGSQSVNYANSAGSATSAGSVAWGNVSGKPSTFTPASHTHDDKYYTKTEVNTKLDGKSNTGHTHDDRYYTESEVDLKLANYQPKGNYAAASHTHNYAGSDSSGGSASSAVKLDSSAGNATQPVYFKDGKPVVTTYALNKTVPADAKFTDTNTWRGIQNNLTSDSTDQSLSAAQGKVLKGLVDGKAPSSHKHTKSQITDFPTSMPASDVSAWAKAATKPSYTKAEVGLGNVDNTADKDKSVKFATSAASATNATRVNGFTIQASTSDLTAGQSKLDNNVIYIVYE